MMYSDSFYVPDLLKGIRFETISSIVPVPLSYDMRRNGALVWHRNIISFTILFGDS